MTWRGGVTILAGGETTPEREKGGDDVSRADTNLTKKKNEKNPYS
jgi:hypothetical protein